MCSNDRAQEIVVGSELFESKLLFKYPTPPFLLNYTNIPLNIKFYLYDLKNS